MEMPSHAVHIKDLDDLQCHIQPGQHYAVWRPGLKIFHHFLTTSYTNSGKIDVIHYTGGPSHFVKSSGNVVGIVAKKSVKLTDKNLFDVPKNLYRIEDPSYKYDEASVQEVIERATERVGEASYGATYNNCEHVARWAMSGKPWCEQLDEGSLGLKITGAIVDEGPVRRLAAKAGKETLYAGVLGIEKLALKGGSRLLTHTASAGGSCLASTAGATFGLGALFEIPFTAYQISKMYGLYEEGKIGKRDFHNAKDITITGSVFSTAGAAGGAVIGQLVIPVPFLGASLGSLAGGLLGRLSGLGMAAGGIAIKEWIET